MGRRSKNQPEPLNPEATLPDQPIVADEASASGSSLSDVEKQAVAEVRGRGRPRKVTPPVSNGPSPDRVAKYLAQYTTLKTEAQRVAQSIGTVIKNLKTEGGDGKALKALHASLKLDKAEATARLATLVRYHAGEGIRVTFSPDDGQGSLDDVLGTTQQPAPAPNTKGTRDLARARAHSDGFNSGLSDAAPSDNPFRHAPGSEEYVAWHDGRDDGQRSRENGRVVLADSLSHF
jgi:uncharacterized protein (UPF0335 family)